MPKVTVQVTNPNDMYLSVTAVMPLAEWREIAERVTGITNLAYYGPVVDLMGAIKKAIRAIEDREAVEYQKKGSADADQ